MMMRIKNYQLVSNQILMEEHSQTRNQLEAHKIKEKNKNKFSK